MIEKRPSCRPLAKQACAQGAPAGSAVEAAYGAILANPRVIKTLEDIKADDESSFAESWARLQPKPPIADGLCLETPTS